MASPVYEKRPDGLLLGRPTELIELALRCNPGTISDVDEQPAIDDVVSKLRNDVALLFDRNPWRGDVGHDDDWTTDRRERDELDLRRNIPGRVSMWQTPEWVVENVRFDTIWCLMSSKIYLH